MKNGILLFLAFFLNSIVYGQDVALEWVSKVGTTTTDFALNIATDAIGNVYTTGYFEGTFDFDQGAGIHNLTSVGDRDIFITKSDAAGNFVWAKSFGSTFSDEGQSIAIDPLGNIYFTGHYSGTTDFDPGLGIFNLYNYGSWGSPDIFICKLDTYGNLIWVNAIGGTGFGGYYGKAITFDSYGYFYLTGNFSQTCDFDPSAGISNLTAAGGTWDVFVCKYNTAGSLIWARSMGGGGVEESYSVTVDISGNVYTTGYFNGTMDFDPGIGIYNLNASGEDIFVSKLDASGNFVWAKRMGGVSVTQDDQGKSIAVDVAGNVYTTGLFEGTVDFDPGLGTVNLTSTGGADIFISKLDFLGNFVWVKKIGGSTSERGGYVKLDSAGNLFTIGNFAGTIDFDPGLGVFNLPGSNFFILKLEPQGNFVWAKAMGGYSEANAFTLDDFGNIYVAGGLSNGIPADFDPNNGTLYMTSAGSSDIFVLKLNQKNVSGRIYQDFNQNCIQNSNEVGLSNRIVVINPGNIVTTTNISGIWSIDSLPIGNYTIIADTSGNWLSTCPIMQNFTVVHPDSITVAPYFGFISTTPCSTPDIKISTPFLRPGFSNQKVYVDACNLSIGTNSINNPYILVELDALLTVQSGSHAYTSLGNNKYQVNVGTLYPGYCANFWLSCTLSPTAILGQTLCMNAKLYPVDSCALDSIPNPYPMNSTPCNTSYDQSHLDLDAFCNNDTINFTIINNGTGNMSCFAPVRLYIDGIYTQLDSVQIPSGDTVVFAYAGDGRTWRMEVNQHPLHPGNSNPSTTIERCGNVANWAPNLVNILPHDDADPIIDIYCGLVTGSYDPNDKTGYPLGVGTTHDIQPNQEMDYVIRFQNTGTDTAFTVVIRDTLSMDLDVFSVRSGASSHDYTFRMYGPRVLEWTFNNIMLPDSNVNLIGSNGFVTFKVRQVPNLPVGTVIENSASIYFDFNAPIFTNTSWHTIDLPQDLNWDGVQTLALAACSTYTFNNIVYDNAGTYWQVVNNAGLDSLYTLNIEFLNNNSIILENACYSYTAPDAQVYTTSGQYTAIIPNAAGCDSTITINLTIKDSSSTAINETVCNSYTAPDAQVYTSSGQYTAIIPNAAGCDSTITINLTIDQTPTDSITLSGTTLTAYTPNISYQWLDCNNGNAPIAGETNQSFTPLVSGNYAVEMTDGTCTLVSGCVNVTGVLVSELNNNLGISIYPNPTTGILHVEKKDNAEISIEVLDNLGRVLLVQSSNDLITNINLSQLSAGVYYISISNGQQIVKEKIVKQ